MKRVLITGANSYVGTNVEKWLMKEPDNFYVETLDMRDPNWKNFDFSKFDVVFHVAGIVHIKETKKNREQYYKVNRDLAVETAKKSKESGVKHFILMSTMAVYNDQDLVINYQSTPNPTSYYAKSKLESERLICEIISDEFQVSIIRPPMVYGFNSPGNYKKLSTFIKKYKILLKIDNIKSFIFIDNLSYFVKNIIISNKVGIFHPHNFENTSTYQLCKYILEVNNLKAFHIPISKRLLQSIRIKKIQKLLNTHYYNFPNDQVSLINLKDSVEKTEISKGDL